MAAISMAAIFANCSTRTHSSSPSPGSNPSDPPSLLVFSVKEKSQVMPQILSNYAIKFHKRVVSLLIIIHFSDVAEEEASVFRIFIDEPGYGDLHWREVYLSYSIYSLTLLEQLVSQVTREGKYVQSDVPRQFGSQDGSSKTQVHALLSLLLHVCSFVIKNLRPGIQIAGSFKAAILILCCNTFHVAYSFCLHGEACQDDPKHHCPDMVSLRTREFFLLLPFDLLSFRTCGFLTKHQFLEELLRMAFSIYRIMKFTNLKYSRVEIDEVRFEWAECMLDYI
ncbi:hypothetical protein ZIOFF_043013 [Zingiber officinale]|uniref:Uncharacterized protein n=1 Tax=Zingiber officinale TaxID=94328 RepID=A0A8J5KTS3_ZINOF|nr:hypothetical protein ZIOFF_043013 [Zingiber officinale]